MSFVGLSFHDLAGGDVFFEIERIFAAKVESRFFDRLDFDAGLGDLVGDFVRNDADAVFVAVKQVARADFDAADPDGLAIVDEPDISVRNAGIEAEEMESDGGDFVEVARAAACDVTDAAEFLVDQGGDFAELGSDTGSDVQILADGDFRAGHGRDIAKVIGQDIFAAGQFAFVRRQGASLRGDGVTEHHALIRQETSNRVGQIAQMSRTDLEKFDRVGNGRRVEAPELVKLGVREHGIGSGRAHGRFDSMVRKKGKRGTNPGRHIMDRLRNPVNHSGNSGSYLLW